MANKVSTPAKYGDFQLQKNKKKTLMLQNVHLDVFCMCKMIITCKK